MRKSKKFASMPVFSLEEGQQIGTVKGLVLDPAGKKVAALLIEQKGWFKEQRFIPYHKVHSVGDDAITIEKTSGVDRAASLPEIVKLLREKVGLIGARIVAENGTVLGYVDEFYVDIATGTIAGLEFSGNFINSVIKGRAFMDIAYVRTLGKEVVVINNEGIENIFKLDGGLQETVKTIRESTGHLWESTVQKTKEFSTSINKSLDKVKKDRRTGLAPEDEAFKDELLTEEALKEDLPGKTDQDPEHPALVEAPPHGLPDDEFAPREDEAPKEEVLSPGSGSETSKSAPPPA